jgi:large subunit ribosomal protein L4
MPGGGRAFGPRPRDYRTELPKKQRRQALVSALSLKATESAITVLESLTADAPKTSQVAGVLRKMGVYGKRTLLVVDQQNEAVWKSVRNIDRLNTTLAHQLNTYDLVNADAIVLTQDGLARVKEVFSK